MQSLDLAAEDRAELEAKVLAAAFKQSFEAGDSDGAGLAHTHLCAILQAREAATKANEFGQTERSKQISATIDRLHRAAVTRAECVLVVFRPSEKLQQEAAPPEINLEVKEDGETTSAYSTTNLRAQETLLAQDSLLRQSELSDEGTSTDDDEKHIDFQPAPGEELPAKSMGHVEHSDTQGATSPESQLDEDGIPVRKPWTPPDWLEKEEEKPETSQAEGEADAEAPAQSEPDSQAQEPSDEEDSPGKPDIDDLAMPPSEPGAGPLSYLDFGDTEDDTTPAPEQESPPPAPTPEPPKETPKVQIKVPIAPSTEPAKVAAEVPQKTTSGATRVPEIVAPVVQHAIAEGAAGNFYEALGVGDTSTYEVIHTSFLRRLRSHIRTHQAQPPESVSRGEIKAFKEQLRFLCIAHDILKDPVTRTDYDLRRLGLRQLDGPEGGGRLNGGKRTALKIGELLECANIIQPTELQVALDMHKAEPNMPFGQFLLTAGFLTEEELDSAILGQKLITFGKITVAQFQTAINLQRMEKVPFFDTLVSEGWLTPADIFDESSELFGGPGFGNKEPEQKPPEPETVPQIVMPEVKQNVQPQSNELDPVAFNIQMSWEGEVDELQSEEQGGTTGGTSDSSGGTATATDTGTASDAGNGKDNPARQSKQGMKKPT